MLMAIQKAKTADRERELERIVDDWLDKTRDEREEKLAEETTEEQKMKGSIIDDTTAIGKRLNELTSKQVAVAKTAAPPPLWTSAVEALRVLLPARRERSGRSRAAPRTGSPRNLA